MISQSIWSGAIVALGSFYVVYATCADLDPQRVIAGVALWWFAAKCSRGSF